MTQPPEAGKCQWTLADEKAFIDFLIQHASAAGDGANFKMVTFTAATAVVNEKRSAGAPKTGKACQNKWSILRMTFRAIQAIKAKSGWTWTNDKGANITPDMEPEWLNFLKAHPRARPFKSKGWVHLEKMTQVMPATVKGAHIFCPSQGTTGLHSPEDPFNSTPIDNLQEADAPVEDMEDEDEEEATQEAEEVSQPSNTPSTPPRASSNSRKRERASSETPAPLSKRTKLTAATAINGLTHSINRFGENICIAIGGGSEHSSPSRCKAAIRKVQTEDWLSWGDQLVMLGVFENNTKAADAYLSIDPKNSPFCHMWVENRLEEVKEVKEAKKLF
ncbi:hypothetical protein CPB84DRAFT_1967138 [Gymnopilus junonius]|uniref:Myb/SANT-like domain-containing protein n=1 Tax=Gymnopilus junonius TaxID=109634 RepID=A0A9P5N9D8_GYMJU|nr:hypothetical protein CPB84DRAFT_1967138 [Gymnopilus junonius]